MLAAAPEEIVLTDAKLRLDVDAASRPMESPDKLRTPLVHDGAKWVVSAASGGYRMAEVVSAEDWAEAMEGAPTVLFTEAADTAPLRGRAAYCRGKRLVFTGREILARLPAPTPAERAGLYPSHPAAEAFPLLAPFELGRLADDIKLNGLQVPIVLLNGQVLDGRNRQEACHLAGVEPRYENWQGDGDPFDWVVSQNLHRRHLDSSQRSMVAALLPKLRERKFAGRPAGQVLQTPDGHKELFRGKSAQQAAAILNVSTRSVEHAQRVIEHGAPELVEAVRSGSVAVSVASDLANAPQAEQREVLAADDEKAIRAKAREFRDRDRAKKAEKKAAARKAKEEEILADAPAMPGIELVVADVEVHTQKLIAAGIEFDFTHADAPWRYDDQGANGNAEKHYDSLDVDDIVRHVEGAYATAKDDTYLLMWVTNTHLAEWFEAALTKGFSWRYVTNLCWRKKLVGNARGTGTHVLGEHELCLLYAKGMPRPHVAPPRSAFDAPRSEHSEKPEADLARLLIAYTAPASRVRDLYAGRAPLARACRATGRSYIGCDNDAERVQTAMAALAAGSST